MDIDPEDEIIITALLKRFTNARLPKALALEKRVLAGEQLNNLDMAFLDMVFHDAQYILRYSDKYPEFQEIVSKAIEVYTTITQKALENEKSKKE